MYSSIWFWVSILFDLEKSVDVSSRSYFSSLVWQAILTKSAVLWLLWYHKITNTVNYVTLLGVSETELLSTVGNIGESQIWWNCYPFPYLSDSTLIYTLMSDKKPELPNY